MDTIIFLLSYVSVPDALQKGGDQFELSYAGFSQSVWLSTEHCDENKLTGKGCSRVSRGKLRAAGSLQGIAAQKGFDQKVTESIQRYSSDQPRTPRRVL